MTYNDILEIASEVIHNDYISEQGLTLVYELPPRRHRDLDEHLFYKLGLDEKYEFEHRDIIDLEIEGIRFKFIEEGTEITVEESEEEETEESEDTS